MIEVIERKERKRYRTRRAIPAKESAFVGVIMEPGLRVRLGWLAESQHTSVSALVESIVAAAVATRNIEGASHAIST